MTIDKLIEAVEKLHADTVALRNSCRDAMERGKGCLSSASFFMDGEVAAYARCLDMLKAKQAEERE
jgi:hypothetical protein